MVDIVHLHRLLQLFQRLAHVIRALLFNLITFYTSTGARNTFLDWNRLPRSRSVLARTSQSYWPSVHSVLFQSLVSTFTCMFHARISQIGISAFWIVWYSHWFWQIAHTCIFVKKWYGSICCAVRALLRITYQRAAWIAFRQVKSRN